MEPVIYESNSMTYSRHEMGDMIDWRQILELLGYDLNDMDIFQWAAARDVLIDYALPRLTGECPGIFWKAAVDDPKQAEYLRKAINQGGLTQ